MLSQTSQLLFRRLLQEMAFEANVSRQQTAQKLIDYYDGKQLDYLKTVMDEQFGDPTSLKMQLAMDNITRFVADEVSRVFDEPPVITADTPSGQALVDSLTADGMFALALKVAEVYANLTDICSLHPWYDAKTNTIKTVVIPSSSLFVAQRNEDPAEAEAVVYSRQVFDAQGVEYTEYVHWDEESTFIFDNNQMGVYRPPSADNPNMINPYQIIPFAWLRSALPVGSFFTTVDEGLINAQDTLNILLTEANQLAKFQGFAQPVMIGKFDPKNPIVIDPSKPIKVPQATDGEQPADFRFVSPPSHIKDILSQVTDLITRTVTRRGISALALKGESGIASGYAMKIANARLDRQRVDAIPLARACINQWWEIVKRINNAHFATKVPLESKIEIEFAEPSYDDGSQQATQPEVTDDQTGSRDDDPRDNV